MIRYSLFNDVIEELYKGRKDYGNNLINALKEEFSKNKYNLKDFNVLYEVGTYVITITDSEEVICKLELNDNFEYEKIMIVEEVLTNKHDKDESDKYIVSTVKEIDLLLRLEGKLSSLDSLKNIDSLLKSIINKHTVDTKKEIKSITKELQFLNGKLSVEYYRVSYKYNGGKVSTTINYEQYKEMLKDSDIEILNVEKYDILKISVDIDRY